MTEIVYNQDARNTDFESRTSGLGSKYTENKETGADIQPIYRKYTPVFRNRNRLDEPKCNSSGPRVSPGEQKLILGLRRVPSFFM